jgi:hypothetical protein
VTILVLAILLGLIPAAIASSKGRSFGAWWLYGALLFIVALPHALIMRPDMRGQDRDAALSGFRKCPFCAEYVRPEAVVCKHCGRDLPDVAPAFPVGSTLKIEPERGRTSIEAVIVVLLILAAMGAAAWFGGYTARPRATDTEQPSARTVIEKTDAAPAPTAPSQKPRAPTKPPLGAPLKIN